MIAKCPKCGTENSDNCSACKACGYLRPTRVVLTCATTGKELAIGVDTAVGRGCLKLLGDPDSIFASDPQFHILRDQSSGEWLVLHDSGAKNPTFLNGTALSTKCTLRDGAYLTLGPSKLRLNVEIRCT